MGNNKKLNKDFYLGIVSMEKYNYAKDVAMCRFNIKKSKRTHYSDVMDEMLKVLIEHGAASFEDEFSLE